MLQLPKLLYTDKENRRVYEFKAIINNRQLELLIIDPHYELNHSEDINDEKIYLLVQQLNGKDFEIEDKKDNFEYFTVKKIFIGDKAYKLICCLENQKFYLGIIDAYRQSKFDKK